MSVLWVILRLMMARSHHHRLARVILMTWTVGRTGRVVRRAHRHVRARTETLGVRGQCTVRAAILTFELSPNRQKKSNVRRSSVTQG